MAKVKQKYSTAVTLIIERGQAHLFGLLGFSQTSTGVAQIERRGALIQKSELV